MGVEHVTKDLAADAAAGKAGSADWNKPHLAPQPWNIFSFHARNTGRTWVAPPPGPIAVGGDGLGSISYLYTRFTLKWATQVRFQMQIKVAGPATLKIYPVVTYWNGSSFVEEPLFNVATEGQLATNTTGYKDTGWKAVNAGAHAFDPAPEILSGGDDFHKAPQLRLMGVGGDGATSVDIAMMLVQAR